MYTIILIAIGGAAGALSRFAVNRLAYKFLAAGLPIGTLLANITGCFLIGFFWGIFDNFHPSSYANQKAIILTGFLGAFTTFSTYALESLNLLKQGAYGFFALNILVNNVVGIALTFIGFSLSKFIFQFYSR